MKGLILILAALTAMCSQAASPIEGDWQVNNGGARLRFAARAGSDDTFDILWLDGPDLSIEPLTIVGTAVASPSAGTYDCTVDTDPRGKGDKKNYARFVIRLDADTGDSFVFTPYRQGISISFQALLPYWWRRPVKNVDTRPAGLDGARRLGAPKHYVEL